MRLLAILISCLSTEDRMANLKGSNKSNRFIYLFIFNFFLFILGCLWEDLFFCFFFCFFVVGYNKTLWASIITGFLSPLGFVLSHLPVLYLPFLSSLSSKPRAEPGSGKPHDELRGFPEPGSAEGFVLLIVSWSWVCDSVCVFSGLIYIL